MANLAIGFVLLFAAAVSGGLYTTPMGPVKDGVVTKTGWSFEATWFVYALVANIMLPWIVALLTIPDLLGVIGAVDGSKVFLAALFGILWGVGCQSFGIGISMLGNSLGFALILGLAATLGSVIPLVALHPDEVGSKAGILNFVGLGLAVLALVVTGYAGVLKDCDVKAHGQSRDLISLDAELAPESSSKSSFSKGVVVCVFSGIFSACLNLGTTFGKPLADGAVAKGAAQTMKTNAIYAVSIAAGGIPCLLFCGYTMIKERRSPFAYTMVSWVRTLLTTTLMAVLWFGSNVAYGIATVQLPGDLGAVVGWPIYIIGMVLVANISGILSGEWRSAGCTAKLWMGLGILILCLAIGTVGLAG